MNFIRNLLKNIVKESNDWKVNILLRYLKDSEKVLDFGCGDLSLSNSLKYSIRSIGITGVDIVSFKNNQKDIKFIKYDGGKLPFKDNSFDTVISFYVFHHCDDAIFAFRECARVAKKKVIFVESVFRHKIELPFMRIMDWIYNKVKPESVSLSYQFYSYDDWIKIFSENKLKLKSSKKIKQIFFPTVIPIGISYIFEVVKTK